MPCILIIDDEEDLHYSFERNFRSLDCDLSFASSAEEGLKIISRAPPAVVVMDIRMGGLNGLEALKRIRRNHPHLPVIMMTAYGTTRTAIDAMKEGAFDYVIKPFDVQTMRSLLLSALKASRDMTEKVSYQPLLQKEEYDQGIIGKSAAMQEVYKRIGQVSASDAPVMITGETGCGKELVARAIVQHSPRAGKPFLAINCAAIPENLLESELFGHEKGAFTGAMEHRIGKFQQCDRGAVFLDEIGDMPLALQAKLLRVLQDGEITRVGSNQPIRVDIRFIAATNRKMEEMTAAKTFREDLYYRLNVVRIHLPPLRERREDIPLLAEYFLNRIARKQGAPAKQLSSGALERLCSHNWPGNVRELENLIQRAAVLSNSTTLIETDVVFESASTPPRQKKQSIPPSQNIPPSNGSLDEALNHLFDAATADKRFNLMAAAERFLITRALSLTHGNRVQAAKLLGMTRATLRKRIEKYGIRHEISIN
ncbi:MAG: sigma-54 dependent transcriptional regulator [Verrucomicrobiae bacterium]|nr:sigma-54 dependent transcriptional regulator [Verrucomicrobiae bacterium]